MVLPGVTVTPPTQVPPGPSPVSLGTQPHGICCPLSLSWTSSGPTPPTGPFRRHFWPPSCWSVWRGGFLAGQPTLKPAYSAASPQGAVQAQGDVRCVQPHSHHLSLCRHPGGSPSSPTSWSRVTFWDILSPHGSAVAETPPFLGGFSRPFLLAHTPPHTLGGSSSLPCFSSLSPYLLASATWGLLK